MDTEGDWPGRIDLEKEIKCPRCNNVMKQILISKQNYAVTVDRCDHCEGYWFDRFELEKVLDEKVKEGALQYEESTDKDDFFKCPRCEGNTETKKLYNVKVDLCMICGGIWLDKGELETVQQSYRIEENQLNVLGLMQEALET